MHTVPVTAVLASSADLGPTGYGGLPFVDPG